MVSETIVGGSTFFNCTSLASVIIGPNSKLEELNYGEFKNCSSLESISLPSTLKKISGGVFEGCTRLTSLTFRGTQEQWNAVEKSYDAHLPSTIEFAPET